MLTENQKIEAREIADLLLAGYVEIAGEKMSAMLETIDPEEVATFREAVHHYVCGDGTRIPANDHIEVAPDLVFLRPQAD